MKKLFTLLIIVFTTVTGFSQAIGFMNVNNVTTRVNALGELFYDRPNFAPAFEVPANSNSYAIYYANLAVIAEDSAANRFGMLTTYSGVDTQLGPLRVGMGNTTSSVSNTYNKVWSVSASEVADHIARWNDPSYTTPQDILSWPAHEDTSQAYSFDLAPFVDANNNGVYEPLLGDYPEIKGFRALYYIFNDARANQTSTGGSRMGLEVHCMVYAFPANNQLNETIFVEYRVINRSSRNLVNMKVGQFVDFDLGNPTDDFIETDFDRNMVYAKNGDNFDDNFAGTNGYGTLHGAIGMITLKGPKLDDDQLDNPCLLFNTPFHPNGSGFSDGIIDNERYGLTNCISYNSQATPIGGDVTSDLDLHRYMNSRWKNNRPQTFGGDGYQIGGGTPSRVPYFLNTDTSNYATNLTFVPGNWSENSANNVPGDRKVITATGPFSLGIGEEMDFAFAYVFARSTVQSSVINSVDRLKRAADTVIAFYRTSENLNQCTGSTVGLSDHQEERLSSILYPNPAADRFSVELEQNAKIIIYDLNGKLVLSSDRKAGANSINIPQSLEAGIYFVRIDYPQKSLQRKLIVNR